MTTDNRDFQTDPEQQNQENIATPPVQNHTTIIKESSGSSFGVIAMFIVAILVLGGFYLFSNNKPSSKDVAIEDAAQSVEKAATQAGAAAEKIGDSVENAADKMK